MDPNTFMTCVEHELGVDFAKGIRLEDSLDLLVNYLAEEEPFTQISYTKLKMALTSSEADAPLQQHGVEEIQAYQEQLRGQLQNKAPEGGGKATGAKTELQSLVKFLSKDFKGLRDLIGDMIA